MACTLDKDHGRVILVRFIKTAHCKPSSTDQYFSLHLQLVNMGLQLLDCNNDCLYEIMKFLPLRDLISLEFTNSRFGHLTEHYYKKETYYQLDASEFDLKPIWFWEKLGRHILKLDLRLIEKQNRPILAMFQSAKRLRIGWSTLTTMCNLPPNLEILELHACALDASEKAWFKDIPSSLHSIKCHDLQERESRPWWQHFRGIRTACFKNAEFGSDGLTDFLRNNQYSLTTLSLSYMRKRSYGGIPRIPEMPNVTSLTLLADVDFGILQISFKNIEYLRISKEAIEQLQIFNPFVRSALRLKYVRIADSVNFFDIDKIVSLIVNVTSVIKIEIDFHELRGIPLKFLYFLTKVALNLPAGRHLTIVNPQMEVSNH